MAAGLVFLESKLYPPKLVLLGFAGGNSSRPGVLLARIE